ncbi:GtrA family protein [Undibacterium flavidum]|uniref:GtrA family protein n=1 Tax=Undibacterium flavidum TaxID=2762297 RepID=A0ABR6YGN7_9BURK|nr:GtrA family protein [Undibacterium flavidum]MBC3875708.1 GtrA family protein [Undibacterium flavidum]
MNKIALGQFLRFAAVGLSGTAVQYLSIQVAVMLQASVLQQSPAVTGSAIGYLLGSVVNYILNYFFTFGSGKSHVEAASKYFSVLAIGWGINLGLMKLLVDQWGIWHWYAQVFTTGLVLCWNFAGSKLWAFKETA